MKRKLILTLLTSLIISNTYAADKTCTQNLGAFLQQSAESKQQEIALRDKLNYFNSFVGKWSQQQDLQFMPEIIEEYEEVLTLITKELDQRRVAYELDPLTLDSGKKGHVTTHIIRVTEKQEQAVRNFKLLGRLQRELNVDGVYLSPLGCQMKGVLGYFDPKDSALHLNTRSILELLYGAQMDQTSYHEMAHAMFQKMRTSGKDSIYHTSWMTPNRGVTLGSASHRTGYMHFVSAEELYTYTHGLFWYLKKDLTQLDPQERIKLLETLTNQIDQIRDLSKQMADLAASSIDEYEYYLTMSNRSLHDHKIKIDESLEGEIVLNFFGGDKIIRNIYSPKNEEYIKTLEQLTTLSKSKMIRIYSQNYAASPIEIADLGKATSTKLSNLENEILRSEIAKLYQMWEVSEYLQKQHAPLQEAVEGLREAFTKNQTGELSNEALELYGRRLRNQMRSVSNQTVEGLKKKAYNQ